MDTGPIIAQAVVPVLPGDDEAALTARILKEAHGLYPLVVKLVATVACGWRAGAWCRTRGRPWAS